MLLWTPAKEPFDKHPLSGTLVAVRHPSTLASAGHTHSACACGFGWQNITHTERIVVLTCLVRQMEERDGICRKKILEVLANIRDLPPQLDD